MQPCGEAQPLDDRAPVDVGIIPEEYLKIGAPPPRNWVDSHAATPQCQTCETGKGKRIKKCIERYGNWVQGRCRALPDSSRPADSSRVDAPEGKEVELDVPEVAGSKEVSVPVAKKPASAPPPKKRLSALRDVRRGKQVLNIQEPVTVLNASEQRQQA